MDGLFDQFEARIDDARSFALRNRVALLRAANGVPIDVALGALDFEQRAVERASLWDVKEARLQTCSAEDLIVHKAFAGRERDWLDVEGIVIRQGTASSPWCERCHPAVRRPVRAVRRIVSRLWRLSVRPLCYRRCPACLIVA